MKRRFVLKSIVLAWPLLVSCSSSANDSKDSPVKVKTETNAETVSESVAEQPVAKPENPVAETLVPKGFLLLKPEEVWSRQKIADCKFEVRSGRLIRDRLLREVKSCESLDAMKAAVDGYLPILAEGNAETAESLQSCSRPLATAEFMNHFSKLYTRCRTENLPEDKKAKLLEQMKKVYQTCQDFSFSPVEISSNISRIDLSSMLQESEFFTKPLTTLSARPETIDLFLKRTTLLANFFKGEAKTVCSLAINDVINGQMERTFDE